ncbi:MAG: hypothetical protein AAF961_04265 [Planctomycetota bacterium]
MKEAGKGRLVSAMGVVILGFCCWGFGTKFLEFVALVWGDRALASEGAFAVTPIANYLLASMGFLCLFGWAAAHGMFSDIEQPKRTMLETEAMLDADRDDVEFSKSVLE